MTNSKIAKVPLSPSAIALIAKGFILLLQDYRGSLRNLKPLSTDCCPLYLDNISVWVVNSILSRTFVANINRPARFFYNSSFNSLKPTLIWNLSGKFLLDLASTN